MSHELTMRKDGTAEMAFAGEVPWHGLGKQVDGLMTPMQALREAGMDWDARLRPLWVRSMPTEPAFQIPDRFAVCRADNGKYLGTVGKAYQILQNREQAEFLEALVGEGATVECLGTLFEGRKQFWTCKVPGDVQVRKEDWVNQYLILANAHDGSQTFEGLRVPIRVVCNNTLRAALGQAATSFSIRHTRNVKNRVEEARRILGLSVQYGKQLAAAFGAFADKTIDKPTYTAILDEVFGTEEDHDTARFTKLVNLKRQVADNMKSEMRVRATPKTARTMAQPTLWDAYNSITYYTSHQMTRRETERLSDAGERRFESVLTGNGQRIQQAAFDACRSRLTAELVN